MPPFLNLMLKIISDLRKTDDDDNILCPYFKLKIETDHIPFVRNKTGGDLKRCSIAAHVKSFVMHARRMIIKIRFIRMNNGGKDSFRLPIKDVVMQWF